MLMQQGAQACGGTLQQRVQASSFEAMCRLAGTRPGITLLPADVLAAPVAAGRLRAVELQEDWAAREMSIVVRDLGEPSRIARAFIDHLQLEAGASS